MLETLDTIEWNQLTHAYGSAKDVPELLRRLLSEEDTVREETVQALFSAVCHQGTVYEATAYAVPFLLELLDSAQTHDKALLLILLQNIAAGISYYEALPTLHEAQAERDGIESPAHLELERTWARNAREAAGEGTALYEYLLEHPNADTRAAAAFALSPFHEQAGAILPALLGRLKKERSSRVKASLLLGVCSLTKADPAYQSLYENALQSETNPLVRVTAAMALARIAPPNLLPEAIEALVQAVPYPNPLYELYAALPACDVDVCHDSQYVLRGLRGEAAQYALPRLLALLPMTRDIFAADLVTTLLELAFGEPDPQQPLDIASLTSVQEDVLTGIVECDACWPKTSQQVPEVPDALRAYGLPSARQALLAALAAR